MKQQIAFLLIAYAIADACAADAAKPTLQFLIEDTTGTKTEVSFLRCSFAGSERFENAKNCVSVSVQGYILAIPTDRLVSVKSSGGSAQVSYNWSGKQRTISGVLTGEFSGMTDLGEFRLSAALLRHLVQRNPSPPRKEDPPYGVSYPATITLTNGAKIGFSGIRCHVISFSRVGYIVGGKLINEHLQDFEFMRSEAAVNTSFDTIQKLEFTAANTVQVTLKDGSTSSGKSNVQAWTGETEQGLALVLPTSVRSLEFGQSTTNNVRNPFE